MSSGMRFVLRRNDLLPSIRMQARYSDGTAVDLTGATSPTFRMRSYSAADGSTPKVAATAVVVDAVDGQLRYDWTGTDTDTAGMFLAEFEVRLNGKRLSFPSADILTVQITEDIG